MANYISDEAAAPPLRAGAVFTRPRRLAISRVDAVHAGPLEEGERRAHLGGIQPHFHLGSRESHSAVKEHQATPTAEMRVDTARLHLVGTC